jgi:hypothetical protein
MDRLMDGHIYKQTDGQENSLIYRWTDRQIDRQRNDGRTGIWTEWLMNRQTDGKIDR